MKIHKSNDYKCRPKVSLILLDWSCRERFFALDWLSRQDVPREEYEIIWIELYDRIVREVMEKADVVITCGQKGRYHKHKGYNAGLLASKGHVITVCDSDAVFPSDFISSIFHKFDLGWAGVSKSQVLMHYERRTKSTYPDGMTDLKELEKHHWVPLWENVGACVSVRRDDALRFGGFDEHGSYRGYVCGPYELAWRIINAGIPEEWHDPEVTLWHFDHPNEDHTNIYKRIRFETFLELGFIRPHLREHSLSAVEAFSTGRILPLKENPDIHQLRMSKRVIGSSYEMEYAAETGVKGFSRAELLLIRFLHFENFVLRFLREGFPPLFRAYCSFVDKLTPKKLKKFRYNTLGLAGVINVETESEYLVLKEKSNVQEIKMNVLFATDDDLTKSVVYDIHVMAEGLSLLGHNVYVIDCKRDKPSWFRTINQSMSRVFPNAKVSMFRYSMLTFPIFTETFRSFISRFLYAVSRFHRIAGKIVKKYDIDVIVLYSVVHSGVPTIRLGKKFNIPVVFRNIDMLYRLNANSMVRSAVAFFELLVYPRVDRILALTPKYAEYMITMGGHESNIEILPFPVEITVSDKNLPLPSEDFPEVCQRWIDKKGKVIVFVGHLYNFSGLGDFIREFPKVIAQVPDARLLLVGDGPMRRELEKTISELNLDKYVFITGLQPFRTMPQYIAMASICINAYPISGDMKDLFAAKVVQYLACGKATVSSALEGMKTMIPGESCGVVYVKDAGEMAEEVILLLKSSKKREELGKAGLEYTKQIHCREKIVLKLEEELRICVGKKTRKNLGSNFARRLVRSLRSKYYENLLYNSANMGFNFNSAGQRIDKIPAGAVVNKVVMFIDKVGNPNGKGSCVVREVRNDSIVGTVGSIDISKLPTVPADPKWVLFDTTPVKIPKKGDYRIVFEWNTNGGDSSNYPRVRFNDTDTIKGVFTQYSSEANWIDHPKFDTSIKIHISR